jgi:hypothetical protein
MAHFPVLIVRYRPVLAALAARVAQDYEDFDGDANGEVGRATSAFHRALATFQLVGACIQLSPLSILSES